jgi:hypothetical protein
MSVRKLLRTHTLAVLGAVFMASSSMMLTGCGGGGGGGEAVTTNNATQNATANATETGETGNVTAPTAIVEGTVPSDIVLGEGADVRAVEGVLDVGALCADGTTVDGYFTDNGTKFVVNIPRGEECKIVFVDRKPTEGQNLPQDATILAVTPPITVSGNATINITSVGNDGVAQVEVSEGVTVNSEEDVSVLVGKTLAQATAEEEEEGGEEVPATGNVTAGNETANATANVTESVGTFFGEAEQGWLTKKAVGIYEVGEKNDIQIDGASVNFAANFGAIKKVGDYVYAFDKPGTNQYQIFLIDPSTKEVKKVAVTDHSPANSELKEIDGVKVITEAGVVVTIDNNAANNRVHIIKLNGDKADAYYAGVLGNAGGNALNALADIKKVKVDGDKVYMLVVDTANPAHVRMIVFDPANTGNEVQLKESTITAKSYKVVDYHTVWVYNNVGNKLYRLTYDFTTEGWKEDVVSETLTRGINNTVTEFFEAASYQDINGDAVDTIAAADIQEVKFLSADANQAVMIISMTPDLDNDDANPATSDGTDMASIVARAKVSGTSITLDKMAPLGYTIDTANTVNVKKVVDVPSDNGYYAVLRDTTGGTDYVVYFKKKTDGSYQVINKNGTVAAANPATFANLPTMDGAFGGTYNDATVTSDNFAVFEKDNTIAQVVYIADGKLYASSSIKGGSLPTGISAITKMDLAPGVARVFVADDTDKEVSAVDWTIAKSWHVVAEAKYGKDGSTSIGAASAIDAVDANTAIFTDNTATVRKHWLVKLDGTTLTRSNSGIPSSTVTFGGTAEYDEVITDDTAGGVDRDLDTVANKLVIDTTTAAAEIYYADPADMSQWGVSKLTLNLDNTANGATIRVDKEGDDVYFFSVRGGKTDYAQVSLADKTDPTIASALFTAVQNNQKNITRIAVSGAAKKMFAIDNISKIYPVDLANVTAPTLNGEGVIGFDPVDADISTDGQYLYVVGSNIVAKVNTNAGIEKSVEQKVTITEGASTHTLNVIMDEVAFAGDYIVIAGHVDYELAGSKLSKAYIKVLKASDLSDVSDWIEVATDTGTTLAGTQKVARVDALYVVNSYVYAHVGTSSGTNNLVTLSVANPASPQITSSITGIGTLSVSAGGAYANDPANANTVKKISLANPANPSIVGVTNISRVGKGANKHLTAYGNYIFVVGGTAGVDQRRIEVIDLEDIDHPRYAGDIVLPSSVKAINSISVNTMDGKTYLTAATNDGIYVVDLAPVTLQ